MKSQSLFIKTNQISTLSEVPLANTAQIALVFSARQTLENETFVQEVKQHLNCPVLFSSTAGQISGDLYHDEMISVTLIELEHSEVAHQSFKTSDYDNNEALGIDLFQSLNREDLAGLMIFADGTSINGSELKEGLELHNTKRVPISGGLAGDGVIFHKTLVGIDTAMEQNVSAIAFYGEHMHIGTGSRGGWSKSYQVNMVSNSNGNVLKEIEGVPALDFYKSRLSDRLKSLPADALKFPLNVSDPFSGQDLVRTILRVDEENKTMTFAGDIPMLANVQILNATKEDLIEGAKAAALSTMEEDTSTKPDLAVLISCVGRMLVLDERTTEEVGAVREVFGSDTTLTGFYSYGELCPSSVNGRCELHNQTMTITTLTESGC